MGRFAELHEQKRQRSCLLQSTASLGLQKVEVRGAIQQSGSLIGDRQVLDQAAKADIVERNGHLLGDGLEHKDVAGAPAPGCGVHEEQKAYVFVTVNERDCQYRGRRQFVNDIANRLKFGRNQRIGNSERTARNAEFVHERDQLSQRRSVGRTHILVAILLDRSGRQPGFAHGCDATTYLPLCTDLVDGRGKYVVGGALLIEFPGYVSHSRQAAYIGSTGRCGVVRRRRTRGGRRLDRRRQHRRGTRVFRSHSRRQVEPLQIFVSFFFVREKLLDALQALDRLRLHSVLHQNFGLQHKVLQGSAAQRNLGLALLLLAFGSAAEA